MKRLFSLFLAMCLLLSLAACGEPAATTGKQEPATTTAGNNAVTTTAPVTVPTTVPETEPTTVPETTPPTEPETVPPTEPTEPPTEPTEPPTEPTEPPTEPTEPPTEPTEPPAEPTEPPTEPTEPPTEPTEPPTEPTEPPTEPNVPDVTETVELVMSYENGSGSLVGEPVGAYRMDFVYRSDYRGGTVTLTLENQVVEGIFTCDENYNINYIEFYEDGAVVTFTTSFDDARRVLSATSYVVEEENTDIRFIAEYVYDAQGRVVYSKQDQKGLQCNIAEAEYDADGRVLRQTSSAEIYVGEGGKYVTVTGFTYDEDGHMKSMDLYDEQGNLLLAVAFTSTQQGENICCTAELGGDKMVMLYNPKGQCILQETYSGGVLTVRIEMEFDEGGLLTKQKTWRAHDDMVIEMTYGYTADGRRCSHVQTVNGEEKVIERTIYQAVEIPE